MLVLFFISDAIKLAVSFSKFQGLYAMLLLWYNLKHGFSVAQKPQSRSQFLVKPSW